MIDEPFLLSTLPPSRRQKRLALVVLSLVLVAVIAAIPFRDKTGPDGFNFIAAIDITIVLTDLITAALLFGQFMVVRTRDLLALAAGYLYSSLIVAMHALTFPKVFSENGLLGATVQTTFWLYVFWHLALPLSAISYAFLKGKHGGGWSQGRSPIRAIVVSVSVVVLLVVASTLLATAGSGLLPPIMIDALQASPMWRNYVAPFIMIMSLTAIVVLWRRRSSLLDLWVLVVMAAWFAETLLASMTIYKFSFVWWVGRCLAVGASCFVLFILLAKSTMLYARLALSIAAQRRERDARQATMNVTIGTIAHELLQPISAIMANGTAGLLLLDAQPLNSGELRGALEDIVKDVRRATGIVDSIRAMGAPNAQTTIDVNESIKETLNSLRMELRMQGIAPQLDLMRDLPKILGNKIQLQQVLINIVTNAVDAMVDVKKRARMLRIESTLRGADAISITVEDSGNGVPDAIAPQIFDPYFTTKAKGTGLGLSICKTIVKAHGGEISMSPAALHGTIFRIDLPLAAAKL